MTRPGVLMALKLYKSPFHVAENEEVANEMVLKTDLALMLRKAMKGNAGSSFDAFLKEEGIYEEIHSKAVKTVISWKTIMERK